MGVLGGCALGGVHGGTVCAGWGGMSTWEVQFFAIFEKIRYQIQIE